MRDASVNPEKIGDVVTQDKSENEQKYSPCDPYGSDEKNEK
jgi:hypothetical protein